MLFHATVNQLAFLFLLIAIGYLLVKLKRIPDNAEMVLSRLENDLFLPALVLGTFATHFTTERLADAGALLLGSLMLEVIVILVAWVCVKRCTPDPYTRNIYLYGLCFSNFGFMGNAIVSALFPDIFMEYMIFTLVLWIFIYVWGVPTLLMGDGLARQSLGAKLRNLLNPMFICMVAGMAIGLSGLSMPSFVNSLVTQAGNCMSPVAMLLTGMTIAKIDIRAVLKTKSIYMITALRLLVFPLAFLGAGLLLRGRLSETFVICAVCSLSMPLGLNTIVIPSALGKDTTVASGMALLSHALSCVSIPLVFLVLEHMR